MVEHTGASAYPEVVVKSDTHKWSIATGGSSTGTAYRENFYIYDHDAAAQRLVIGDAGQLAFSTNEGWGSDGQVLTSAGGSAPPAWEDAGGGGASDIDGLSDAKVDGTDFTDSMILGHQTTGTLDNAYSNTAVGIDAMDAVTSGHKNTAVGHDALTSNTEGTLNTCIGYYAGAKITTGGANTLIGVDAGANINGGITTGTSNILVGRDIGCAIGSGSSNTLMGDIVCSTGAGGNWNTIMGAQAGRYAGAGQQNTGYGGRTLHQAGSTSADNVAMGYHAGYYISSGDRNICIGTASGSASGTGTGVALTTGDMNILIGGASDTSAADSDNQIVIGDNVTGNADDSFCFGYATTDSAIAFGATSITAPSDIRLKEDIEDEVVGLDFINELRPVTFRWKKAKDVPEELKAHSASEKRVMNGKYNHGFISQEVKEVIDNNPDIKEGFDMWTEDEADGRQRIGESALIPMLVKSIQELTARIEELEGE
jgi:hypothetical protein